MKKFLFSNPTSSLPASLGLLVIRLVFGGFMFLGYGIPKLMNFSERAAGFRDPLGIGSTPSLTLVVFAELFCALLVTAGLLTRAALIPLIITMAVAAFIVHGGAPWFEGGKQLALMFLGAYLALLSAGPGKFSIDHLIR